MKMNRIVFVSEMRNPYTNASSTQIMTRNLLYGFHEICKEVIFVVVIDNLLDKEDIELYYRNLCSSIVFIPGITKHRTNPFKSKVSMLLKCLSYSLKAIPANIVLDKNTVIISHSPSIDSALICGEMKRMHPEVRYIQYWGDPLALSLITPEQYTIRRSVQRWVEHRLHKSADSIVYGTRSLGDAQKILFSESANKMRSVEVSYCPNNEMNHSEDRERLLFGYFGNYYSNIRDIQPLYDAFGEISDADLVICGSGNVKLDRKVNIDILQRIPQSEVAEQEDKLDVVVCILNKVGIQIPGKIFYQTNSDKAILVITDGPNKDAIVDELRPSGRFVFCENKKDSIKKTIQQICDGTIRIGDYDSSCFDPAVVCRKIIEDGIDE